MSQEDFTLTDRQSEVIAALPADKFDLADRLNVAPTTAKDHISALRNQGIDIPFDSQAGQYYLQDERKEKLRRISTKHKSTKTREANNLIENEETYLLRRLNQTDPISVPPNEEPDAESFVAILSDTHFGDLVEDEQGNILYNTNIAKESVEKFAEKLLSIKQYESQYKDFSDCHLFLLGDIATGEGIYEGQVHDIESHLADQVTHSTQALFNLSQTLSEHFSSLNIHGVLGNHGQVRASGVSKQANTDLITYRWLDDALRRAEIDNVGIEIAESTHHLNTEIRGWNVHVRHGQDGYKHVDKTRASEASWRGWRDAHQFDLAMRGHYHDPGLDYVLNRYPVISAPSPKPGGEYIERLGSPDVSTHQKLGWAFGISDKRKITFQKLLDAKD
jgi:biotin operon repressor